jgi:hypothetical protein
MEALRDDLNTRMVGVEEQVRALEPPLAQIAHDISSIDKLLPDPSDGPFARLKDTLTSN